jgi:arylsulfatase A-like enzyme
MRRILLSAGLLCLLSLPVAARGAVVILADDAGLGFASVPVPAITSMAAAGVTIADMTAQPNCGPARIAMQTGQWPGRLGTAYNPAQPLPPDTVLLGQRLTQAGVATGWVGKVHMPGHTPASLGYRYAPLWFAEGEHDYWLNDGLMTGDHPAAPVANHLTDRFANVAVRWLQARGDEDWFLFLAPNAVHLPEEGEQRFAARCSGEPVEQRAYCRSLLHLDELVGRVRAAAPDALLIFTTDNGCSQKQPACQPGPVRGYKNSDQEGAVRVPAYMTGAGVGVIHQPVNLVDVPATVLDWFGLPPIGDGVSWLRPLPAERLQPIGNNLRWTVKLGRWKLTHGGRLFDLVADPRELNDVAGAHGDVVADLRHRQITTMAGW